LDARGIGCSFDVEPGLLPRPVCDALGLVVRALIMDAAEHALTGVGDKTIAVALHRRRAIWACSVAHTGTRLNRAAGPRSWRAIAEAHAAELNANFRTQSNNQGTITAVCFAVDRNSAPAKAAS
jgi:two-component sensor histidine kinase